MLFLQLPVVNSSSSPFEVLRLPTCNTQLLLNNVLVCSANETPCTLAWMTREELDWSMENERLGWRGAVAYGHIAACMLHPLWQQHRPLRIVTPDQPPPVESSIWGAYPEKNGVAFPRVMRRKSSVGDATTTPGA